MGLLENFKNPCEIKNFDLSKLCDLSQEVRKLIIDTTTKTGGHLASSLGAVDAIIAMLYCFDFTSDKVIFDVGHQAYAYKILTDRKNAFKSLRQENGISGFPLIFESQYDHFTSGHAGDAFAAALGYCYARDALSKDNFVITFTGDASFVNGESLEALLSTQKKPKNFLVILNDNQMSISPNTNAFSRFLCERQGDLSDKQAFLDKFGLNYVGILDGHDINALIDAFSAFKNNPVPTLIHIKTLKGKGYKAAESDSEYYHGVSKDLVTSENHFADSLSEILSNRIKNDNKCVCIVAGMAYGTGTESLQQKFPKNFIDVGISEDLAVTYASGLALGGLKPIVCIYSTFLQRAYDQIVTNVCMQKLPVTFLIDRAGCTGGDGLTHQGIFDTAYLSHVPNMTVLSPKNSAELEDMLDFAQRQSGPVAIRYPNGQIDNDLPVNKISTDNLWEVIKDGTGKCILAFGARALNESLLASKGTDAVVINARSLKPLDIKMLKRYFNRDIITVEDGIKNGGFGAMVMHYLNEAGYKNNLKIIAFEDKFISHASVSKQLKDNKICSEHIKTLL